jgi:hypothetical protein
VERGVAEVGAAPVDAEALAARAALIVLATPGDAADAGLAG